MSKLQAVVATVCLTAGVAVIGAQQPRDETVQSSSLRVRPAEKTLADRVAVVDAVLQARVVRGAQSRAVDLSDALQQRNPNVVFRSPVVMTAAEYEVVVLDAFKSYGRAVAGTTIHIMTLGRASDLEAGVTYFVMLRHEPDWNALMFVEEDVYRIESGGVTATPLARETEYGKELAGRSESDAAEMLRRAATH